MYLSKKEINNAATNIFGKPFKIVFMSINNQIYVTKNIYLLHKNNSGTLDYLYFRSIVPHRMSNWIENYSGPTESNENIVDFLNKIFIRKCSDLFEYQTTQNIDVSALDSNVYRAELTLGTCDGDDNIVTTTKKYNNLMAADYQNIDVWAEQTTEVSFDRNKYRNQVPVWQKSMNKRFYDKSNQGYHNTANGASLDTPVNGYGNAMDALIQKKEELLKKNNTIL